jgi:hypothetical protein
MSSTIKEFYKVVSSKEGLNGFVFSLWIMITLLTSSSFLLGIGFNSGTTDYWARVDPTTYTFWVGSSSSNPQYVLYITSIGIHAGSITAIAEQINGWSYNGTFFIGDTILLGDFKVMIKSINPDRPSPIELEYYQVYDLKPILIISFFVVTLILAFRVVNLGSGEIKEEQKREQPDRKGEIQNE